MVYMSQKLHFSNSLFLNYNNFVSGTAGGPMSRPGHIIHM